MDRHLFRFFTYLLSDVHPVQNFSEISFFGYPGLGYPGLPVATPLVLVSS